MAAGLEEPGLLRVVVTSRQSLARKPSTKARSFALLDDVSPTPRTCWKHFCGTQEALNKYLINE